MTRTSIRTVGFIGVLLAILSPPGLSAQQASTVDADGVVHPLALAVPFSSLASTQAKQNFLDFTSGSASLAKGDDSVWGRGVAILRTAFPVTIRPAVIGGVQTDVIEPLGGVAKENKHRVLINLHGGGFYGPMRLAGQMESIPIAGTGRITVITVDYRGAPVNHFPAASEDVAAVYKELLKDHKALNIGIYGCSAGGMLAAESVAWFQTHGLPKPGAIGMFGSGALIPAPSDSDFFGAVLTGASIAEVENAMKSTPEDIKKSMRYFEIADLNIKDPLVSPVYSTSVLARFPPSLLLTGTRDALLSSAVYTHAQLVKQGVDADLHVWEGAVHCSFAQPVVDPSVPETREAWDVTVRFFDKHLGK